MTNREWAINQIRCDLENIEDLKKERHDAWERSDRKTYDSLTCDIRDLNLGIKGMLESYLSGEKVFVLREKETGFVIGRFETWHEAREELLKHEAINQNDKTYTPDFYEIVVIGEKDGE